MKVYVVLESWVVDYDSGNSMAIYDTKEKAQKDFDERVRNAKIDMNLEQVVEIEETNMIEEKDEDSYCVYEDGYYSRNHISIRIEEEEVK